MCEALPFREEEERRLPQMFEGVSLNASCLHPPPCPRVFMLFSLFRTGCQQSQVGVNARCVGLPRRKCSTSLGRRGDAWTPQRNSSCRTRWRIQPFQSRTWATGTTTRTFRHSRAHPVRRTILLI